MTGGVPNHAVLRVLYSAPHDSNDHRTDANDEHELVALSLIVCSKSTTT